VSDAPELPDQLERVRHRDLVGRRAGLWTRRGVLTLFAVVAALGLANVFGQRSTTSFAQGPAATLRVSVADRLRGGLLFGARIDVHAVRRLAHPKLVLDDGWLTGITLNTTVPNPAGEASRDGGLVLDYAPIPAGRSLTVWLDAQVNPTNVGRRSQDVELDDGPTLVARVHRTVTVFP
jgi:hypothetical protein